MEGLRRILKLRSKENHDHHSPHHKPMKSHMVRNDSGLLRDGATFLADYLGSTLVEELDEGQSYGNKISARAVKNIHDMAKGLGTHGRKLPRVEIMISVKGIIVTNVETNTVLINLSIHRIHFCTADRHYDHVFAFIARSTENETMECHAFACSKRKAAQAVTLAVAKSFQLAKEDFELAEKEQERRKMERDFHLDNQPKKTADISNIENDCSKIQGFEDNFTDIQITSKEPMPGFPSPRPTNPFRNSSFDMGVAVEDLDKGLLQLLEEKDTHITMESPAHTSTESPTHTTTESSGHLTTNNSQANLISF